MPKGFQTKINAGKQNRLNKNLSCVCVCAGAHHQLLNNNEPDE